MDCVFAVLSFLYEEEKVALILTSRSILSSLSRELELINEAHVLLDDYRLFRLAQELEHQALLQDLQSDPSDSS